MNILTKIALTTASVAFISAPAFASVPAVVHSRLWNHGDELGITTDVSAVKTGRIDFQVINNSRDTVHEIMVRKVKSFDDVLPSNDKDKSVLEDEHDDFGEVASLKPGQTAGLTVNLAPGKYMLIANIPGHDHMTSDLVVTK